MKFVKGQWYTNGESYYQHCSNQQGIDFFRLAGVKDEEIWLTNEQLAKLTPASLTPDFSKAKVGDSCFCATLGNKKIDAADASCAFVHIDLGQDTHEAFYLNGKAHENDIHPTLFNSFAQFMAYWDEWKLNQKGGTDA